MGIIKFISEQLKKNVSNLKGTDYIIKIVNSLPKELLEMVLVFLILYLTN